MNELSIQLQFIHENTDRCMTIAMENNNKMYGNWKKRMSKIKMVHWYKCPLVRVAAMSIYHWILVCTSLQVCSCYNNQQKVLKLNVQIKHTKQAQRPNQVSQRYVMSMFSKSETSTSSELSQSNLPGLVPPLTRHLSRKTRRILRQCPSQTTHRKTLH